MIGRSLQVTRSARQVAWSVPQWSFSVYAMDDHGIFSKLATKILQMTKLKLYRNWQASWLKLFF